MKLDMEYTPSKMETSKRDKIMENTFLTILSIATITQIFGTKKNFPRTWKIFRRMQNY